MALTCDFTTTMRVQCAAMVREVVFQTFALQSHLVVCAHKKSANKAPQFLFSRAHAESRTLYMQMYVYNHMHTDARV